MQNEEVDATILACAGLIRAGLFDPIYCYTLEVEEMLPAAGQGIIAIQARDDDQDMQVICNKINHINTWNLIQAERSFLEFLNADCKTPIAANAVQYGVKDGFKQIKARYMLADIEGKNIKYYSSTCDIDNIKNTGVEAAKHLLLQ